MKKKTSPPFTLRMYVEQVNKELKENDQERTGRAYMTAMRRFNKFLGKEATFDDFTSKTIIDYQESLLREGRAMNTVSFYMRNTRVIYNRACDDSIIKRKKMDLFDKVFTGTAETEKRALGVEEMQSLAHLEIELGEEPKTAEGLKSYECLLYLLFSFHGRGISFIDLCHLRKSNIRGKVLLYVRKKTRKQMVVKLSDPMLEIIEYFAERVADSDFLFPILKEGSKSSLRAQYENALCQQNKRLKEIGRMAGLEKPLSTHVARHSWATIARDKADATTAQVCQGLGHSDERTTAIYLASFEESVIDQISDKVSRLIMARR